MREDMSVPGTQNYVEGPASGTRSRTISGRSAKHGKSKKSEKYEPHHKQNLLSNYFKIDAKIVEEQESHQEEICLEEKESRQDKVKNSQKSLWKAMVDAIDSQQATLFNQPCVTSSERNEITVCVRDNQQTIDCVNAITQSPACLSLISEPTTPIMSIAGIGLTHTVASSHYGANALAAAGINGVAIPHAPSSSQPQPRMFTALQFADPATVIGATAGSTAPSADPLYTLLQTITDKLTDIQADMKTLKDGKIETDTIIRGIQFEQEDHAELLINQ